MFGSKNFTEITFMGKIERASIEFSIRLVEEVTFNFLSNNVSQNIRTEIISQNQLIATNTCVLLNSKIVRSKLLPKLFNLMAGATPNLLI